MPSQRMKNLEKKYGNLHPIIPKLVNQSGQNEAGKQLGVSASTLSKWLKQNGYVLKRQYVRESEVKR